MEASYRTRGEAICRQLIHEISRLGYEGGLPTGLSPPDFADASFETGRDTFSSEPTLCGRWLDAQGRRMGEIKFHGDGSFYAEYDVLLPHPRDARWFVEGVVAWGKGDTIKSEPKLLATPGD